MNSALPVFVTDVFNEWMADVNAALDFPVHRISAHIIEVLEVLKQLDSAQRADVKFPLVILICDFEEMIGQSGSMGGRFETARLNMIICNNTIPTYRQNERLENNFKPTLYPIYHALRDAILNSSNNQSMTIEDIPHTKIDRYFWGREQIYGNDANITNDFIDAIEIKNLQVKITTTC